MDTRPKLFGLPIVESDEVTAMDEAAGPLRVGKARFPDLMPPVDGRDAAMADEFHFAKHLQHYVFCDCDPNPPIGDLTVVEGLVRHMEGCGFAIRCDVCRFAEGVDRPSTQIHIDYVVCDAHLSTAVDNVATRES